MSEGLMVRIEEKDIDILFGDDEDEEWEALEGGKVVHAVTEGTSE